MSPRPVDNEVLVEALRAAGHPQVADSLRQTLLADQLAAAVRSSGEPVRLMARALGNSHPTQVSFFGEHVVMPGDEGVYWRPHPGGLGREGYHLVAVENDGRTFYVPLHSEQFEAVVRA